MTKIEHKNPPLPFPKLWRDRFEWIILLAVTGMMAAVVAGIRRLPIELKIAIAIPFILVSLRLVIGRIVNAVKRFSWAMSFNRMATLYGFRKMLKACPERFLIRIQYYAGFDMARECEAAAILDRTSGDWIAVWPSSRKIQNTAYELRVELQSDNTALTFPTVEGIAMMTLHDFKTGVSSSLPIGYTPPKEVHGDLIHDLYTKISDMKPEGKLGLNQPE